MNVISSRAGKLNGKYIDELKRSSLEVLALNILIPALALVSIGICLLPKYQGINFWLIFTLNVVLTTQIAIMTHELIHESSRKTRWNLPLHINLHLYSPFTLGFSEYKRLHGLHHANANNPKTDPDYFFIRGGRMRAFFALAFAPEYLFFYALRKKETQPGFYLFQVLRIGLFVAYIQVLGPADFLFLFFIPAKLAWGIGFLLFSYESHINEHGEREGTYNLEPRSALLRFLLKLSVGPYAYYVAFSHASHHVYPQVSGRKIGRLARHMEQEWRALPARALKLGDSLTL